MIKERLGNTFLASALLFGGATGASAQEASPQVDLDVSPFIEALHKRVDYQAEPQFFKQLERRAENKPNEYFLKKEVGPNEEQWFYFPEGVTSNQPKVGYIHSIGFLVGNDTNGVPADIPFIAEQEDWYIELGKDGTAKTPSTVDLFNFEEIEEQAEEYFKEPKALEEEEWIEVPYMGTAAYSQKLWVEREELIEGNPTLKEGWLLTGDQNGLLHLGHYERSLDE